MLILVGCCVSVVCEGQVSECDWQDLRAIGRKGQAVAAE